VDPFFYSAVNPPLLRRPPPCSHPHTQDRSLAGR